MRRGFGSGRAADEGGTVKDYLIEYVLAGSSFIYVIALVYLSFILTIDMEIYVLTPKFLLVEQTNGSLS